MADKVIKLAGWKASTPLTDCAVALSFSKEDVLPLPVLLLAELLSAEAGDKELAGATEAGVTTAAVVVVVVVVVAIEEGEDAYK